MDTEFISTLKTEERQIARWNFLRRELKEEMGRAKKNGEVEGDGGWGGGDGGERKEKVEKRKERGKSNEVEGRCMKKGEGGGERRKERGKGRGCCINL